MAIFCLLRLCEFVLKIVFSEGPTPLEFTPMLKGKQSQCLDHMGLTELIKSNNFQQQSYF